MDLNFKKAVFLMCISSVFLSCSTTEVPVTPEVTDQITYNVNVKSIVDNSCATSSCHDAVSPAAGLKLTTYSEVKSSAQSGSFHTRINNGTMPPGNPLPSATIAIITKWQSDGYLE